MQAMLARRPTLRLLLTFNPGRCRDPAALLGALGACFPLRRIDPDGVPTACDPAALLAGGDAMLYLARD
jgi:hypothetical protein